MGERNSGRKLKITGIASISTHWNALICVCYSFSTKNAISQYFSVSLSTNVWKGRSLESTDHKFEAVICFLF